MAIWGMPSISQVNQTISRVSLVLYLQYLGPPTKDMAVVVKTLMVGAGAPLILVYFCRDWDVHWGYRCLTHGHMGDALNIASKPNHFQGFPCSLLAIFRSTDQRYGCGCLMGSHFGAGAPLILVYFCRDWDVHWGYRCLTHGFASKPNHFQGFPCSLLAIFRSTDQRYGCGCQNPDGIPFWGGCRDWDVHWGYRCLTHGHMGDALNIASKPNHFQGFPCSLLAIFRSTDQRYGCGCQNPDGIPFWGGCTTDFSQFLSGLGCSLGVTLSQVNQTISRVSLVGWLCHPGGSHFGAGAPLILVYFCRDWDVHWGYRGMLSHPNHFQGFPCSLLAIFRSTDQRYGCGCQNPDGIPFWGGCTTDFSLFLSGLGCSLGVQVFDMFDPYGGCPQYRK